MPSTAIKKNSVKHAAIKAWAEGRLISIELTDGRIIGFGDGVGPR